MVQAGAGKAKTRGRSKAPRGRGATTGGAESEKRGEGSRKEETGGGTAEASRGGETTEGGNGEVEEERRRQKEADNALCQEADRQAAVVQVRRKNWLKKMNLEPVASLLSEEEMNLLDLPPSTKRQRVRYLSKETLEQRREREEMMRELGIEPMGGGSPCERCANFGILCLPQDLP